MSIRTTSTLADACEITTGFSFKGDKYETTGSLRVVRGENVTVGALRWDSEKFWNHSLDGLEGYFLEENDIVIGMDGSRVGSNRAKVKKSDLPLILAQRVARLRAKAGFDQDFIWYQIFDKRFKDYVEAIHTGTSIPHISMSQIGGFEIFTPSYEEQKVIASILCVLDNKIDLLRRQSKTLEAMSQTLFRGLLTEKIDQKKYVLLGDYVEVFNGVSYKSDDLKFSKTALVTLKNFDRDGGFRLDGFKEYVGKYKPDHIVVQGDLVVAHTDITQNAEVIGNPILVVSDPAYENLVISMDLVKVKPKFDWLDSVFLYSLMRTNEFKQHCLGYSNGSTVLHLSKKAIPSYEFILPPIDILQKYSLATKKLFEKKFKNIEQIRLLERLRNSLLPKLMSGEVGVSFS